MYEDLKSRLEQLVKMELHDYGMGIFLISAEGVNAIRGCTAEAADAIESMNMRLLGDNAAISGMKREIERMVTESSDLNKRLMAITFERDQALKRLCEWCGVCPEDKRDAQDCEIAALGENPERKLAFRSGEEEPGESSSIAAAAAMRSIPPSSDDGGGGVTCEPPHERRGDPEGVSAGQGSPEADQDPCG